MITLCAQLELPALVACGYYNSLRGMVESIILVRSTLFSARNWRSCLFCSIINTIYSYTICSTVALDEFDVVPACTPSASLGTSEHISVNCVLIRSRRLFSLEMWFMRFWSSVRFSRRGRATGSELLRRVEATIFADVVAALAFLPFFLLLVVAGTAGACALSLLGLTLL